MQTLFDREGFVRLKYYVNCKKNAQYPKNTKLQIFSTNILLISQRHRTYRNGNHKKYLIFQDLDTILDTFCSHPTVIQVKEKTKGCL